MEPVVIAPGISYLKASKNPLSAEVGIIQGSRYRYLFDVGSSEESAEAIQRMSGETCVILSHFHPDHIANLMRIRFERLLVGRNTYGYTKQGEIVEQELVMEEEVCVRVFPIPSSHAKGSLGCMAGRYVFVGDAFYPTEKSGKRVYNAGLLKEGIRLLEEISADCVLASHREPFCEEKEVFLGELKAFYARRRKDSPYIEVID